MFSGLVGAGTKALGGNRFALVNLLPVAVLVVLIGGLIRSGAYSAAEPSLARVLPSGDSALALSGAAVFTVFLVAVVLQPFQVAFVRLLEGYWTERGLVGATGRMLIQHHLRRKATLHYEAEAQDPQPIGTALATVREHQRRARAIRARAGRAEDQLRDYPTDEEALLPTGLGNILRAGEETAGARYGLDAMTVYPRLYPYLSPRLDAAMNEQLDMIDTMAAMCLAFTGATLAASPLLGRLDLWSLLPAVLVLAAVFAYLAAKAAARDHTVLLSTAIDLHRFDMLEHLHYPLPRNVETEYDLNFQLTTFLHGREEARQHRFRRLHLYRHAGTQVAAEPGTAAEQDAATDSEGGSDESAAS
jgi:hypothetical protein